MKRLAQILIILALLLTASQAWAIGIYNLGGETPIATVGPEALQNYSSEQINASIPYATGRDRVALVQEQAAQNAPEHERAIIRRAYISNFWGDNSVQYQNDLTDKILRAGGVIADPINNTVDDVIDKAQQIAECGASVGCWLLQAAVWALQGCRAVLSWFLSAANMLLDLSIDFSVRNFNNRIGIGLQEAWKIFRDLVNLTFIFTLLYIAIGTILQLNGVETKKMLKNVIIAALLVNFSFFFTSVMIDASNVVANALYSAAGRGVDKDGENITTNLTGGPDIVSALMGTKLNPANEASGGIAAGIAEKLHNATADVTADTTVNRLKREAAGLIGQILLLIIATTVFMAGAILFLIRVLILVFVLAASPVAFLAFAVGGKTLDKISGKWKDALTNQLIFAPAFMLFIFMSIKVTQTLNMEARSGSDGFFNLLLAYLVANGLMLGSLMVAKELGVAGAAMATKMAGGATGFATKVFARTAVGGIGGGARTFGAGIKETVGGIRKGNWRAAGMGALKATVGTAVGVVKPAAQAGVDVLKSGSGSLKRSIEDTLQKPDEALGEAMASVTGIKILGSTRDDRKEAAKRAEEDKKDEEKRQADKDKATAQNIATDIEKNKTAPGSEEERKAEEAIKKMKDKNVVKLDSTTMKKLAHLFSDNQVKAIEKSDIDEETKEAIRASRDAKMDDLEGVIRDAIGRGLGGVAHTTTSDAMEKTPTALIVKMVNELDDKDAQYKDILRTIATNLQPGQLDKLRAGKEIKRGRLQEIRKHVASATPPGPSPTSPATGGGARTTTTRVAPTVPGTPPPPDPAQAAERNREFWEGRN